MKVKRVRKPSASEVEQFKANVDDLYPLVRVVECEGVSILVEGLDEGPGNPNFEAFAPKGFKFAPHGTRTLLGVDMKDLKDRIERYSIEPESYWS